MNENLGTELNRRMTVKELVLYDDTYTGKRFIYGLNYRPLAQYQVPDGWIIWSNRDHEDFTFGTVDYPTELTAEQIESFELTLAPSKTDGN